jgi:nucleoid-associated protein YgaU
LLAALDITALTELSPHWEALRRHAAYAHAWLRSDPDAAVAQVFGAVLWLIAAWLALALAVAVFAGRQDWAGRVAVAVQRRLVPAVLYRVVASAMGIGVAIAPGVASAAPSSGQSPAPAMPGTGVSGTGVSGTAITAPAWPTDAAAMPTSPAVPPISAPAWPTQPTTGPVTLAPAASAVPGASSRPPATAPVPLLRGTSHAGTAPAHSGPTLSPAPHEAVPSGDPSGDPSGHPPRRAGTGRAGMPTPPNRPSPDAVTVRAGDSLWLIAARRLGPHPGAAQVVAEWPRWYAANRAAIGPDPDLIRPGQVLHAPAATTPHPEER